MTTVRRIFLAAVLVVLGSASEVRAQADDFEAYPLEPPNTSSPQDTLRSFLRYANEAIQHWRKEDSAAVVNHAGRRALRSLDLSDLPPAVRQELGVEKLLLLKEILDRVEIPPSAEIPGIAEVAALPDLKRWVIPRTEIEIVRVPEGPLEGEFLFSAATVADLEHFYALSEHLPYKREASIGIYEDVVRSPGDWIPRLGRRLSGLDTDRLSR